MDSSLDQIYHPELFAKSIVVQHRPNKQGQCDRDDRSCVFCVRGDTADCCRAQACGLFPFIVLVDRELSAGFHLVLPYPMGPQSQCRTFCKLLSVSVPLQELGGVHCDLKLDSESICHMIIIRPH